MQYFISPCDKPLLLEGCGNLVNHDSFLHVKRILPTEFLLILCYKGVLYIEHNSKQYEIGPNQFILLFPGVEHKGFKSSDGELAYYWCHFSVWGNDYNIVNEDEVAKKLKHIHTFSEDHHDYYIIPESGRLVHGERSMQYFKQLLDAAKKKIYTGYTVHYALSLLGLEITTSVVIDNSLEYLSSTYKQILVIMDWIRTHKTENLSVSFVASTFNYHPGYLSNVFKKYIGESLLSFINRTKIEAAKELLLSSNDSINTIAKIVGFADDKYFMRVFKRLEGTTPSKYRNAFYRKFIHKQ
jgi:AraC-like DNA-binding protein